MVLPGMVAGRDPRLLGREDGLYIEGDTLSGSHALSARGRLSVLASDGYSGVNRMRYSVFSAVAGFLFVSLVWTALAQEDGAMSMDDAQRWFDQLSAGGRVVMPFNETFWSPGFGSVIDKFGVPWMINVIPPAGWKPKQD
jgi:hypothetical protein